MNNATAYRIRADAKTYLATLGHGYSWVGKAKQAAILSNRVAAETAAQEIEALITLRCGSIVKLQIVPVTGGVAITRKPNRTT